MTVKPMKIGLVTVEVDMSADAATVLAAAVAVAGALGGSYLTHRFASKDKAEERRETERVAALERYRTVYTDFVAAITKCRTEAKARFDATGPNERHYASDRFAGARVEYGSAFSRALMQAPDGPAAAVHSADEIMLDLFSRMLEVNEGAPVTDGDRRFVDENLISVINAVINAFRADLDAMTTTQPEQTRRKLLGRR